MAAEASRDNCTKDVGRPVIEQWQTESFGMLGCATVEERGAFAKGTDGFAARKIAEDPDKDSPKDESNEQVGIGLIHMAEKADRAD